ncbi:Cytochrome c heme lyase [Caligus rogercresseyi]|uniref:Holocytochrome c-type synthase n=1 Tax=Caligus rogercresseyi TaxID=217165 RepID=A0A7T8GMK7_CALRO|nr:Cytochrome c heme lyase [Caligus rogercresseyi]
MGQSVSAATASTPLPSPPSECPMHNGGDGGASSAPGAPSSGCMKDSKDDIDPLNMMPPPNQRPAPDQPFDLNTSRERSNSPRQERLILGHILPRRCFGTPCCVRAGAGGRKRGAWTLTPWTTSYACTTSTTRPPGGSPQVGSTPRNGMRKPLT